MLKKRAHQGFVRTYLHQRPYIKFIAPAMVVLFILSIVPTIFLFGVSFTNYQLGWKLSRAKFVGFNNYIRLFSGRDPDFWHAVFISLEFMVLATAIEMILGFIIALMLNARESKVKPLIVGILIIGILIVNRIMIC